jgi:hypothetical protein
MYVEVAPFFSISLVLIIIPKGNDKNNLGFYCGNSSPVGGKKNISSSKQLRV